MKYRLTLLSHLLLSLLATLTISSNSDAESKYMHILQNRREAEKLINLTALEEAGIIDTSTISIYINDREPLIRLRCAEVLGRVQSKAGIPFLRKLLSDSNKDVVSEALFALGLIGDPSSVEAIISCALSNTIEAKKEAILALGRIGSEKAKKFIVEQLSNFNPLIRVTSCYALVLTRDSLATTRCISLLTDPSSKVLQASLYALGRLKVKGGEAHIVELLGHSESMVRLRAVEALGKLKFKKAVSAISLLAMRDKDRMVRLKATEALSRIGTKEAIKTLEKLAGSEDPYIQIVALEGIAKSKKSSSYKEIAHCMESPSAMVRRACLKALVETGGRKALDIVRKTIEEQTPLERMSACELLGKIGERSDLEFLTKTLLHSKDHFLREGAGAGIGNWKKIAELSKVFEIESTGEKISALDALSICSADSDWVVATISVESLSKILSKKDAQNNYREVTINRFLNIFKTRTSRLDGDLRLAICEATKKIEEAAQSKGIVRDKTIELLRLGARDPDPRVRERAVSILKGMGVKAEAMPGGLWKRGNKPWTSAPLPSGEKLITIKTNKGDIKVRLFGDDAPVIVHSLLHLIKSGFYNGLTFHRVVPGFVIQGGDPRGDGWGDAGYFLRSEFNRHRYKRGAVGMAHAGKDTPGCQFFITQLPQPHLDGRYTVVGEVIDGMDVVDRIEEQDIFSIEIQEKQ